MWTVPFTQKYMCLHRNEPKQLWRQHRPILIYILLQIVYFTIYWPATTACYIWTQNRFLIMVSLLGGCGSGGKAVAHWFGGLIPGSSSPHANVFFGKIFNPKLLLMAAPMVCECVCVNASPYSVGQTVYEMSEYLQIVSFDWCPSLHVGSWWARWELVCYEMDPWPDGN